MSTEPQPLADIVAVGSDADLWLTAISLSRALGKQGPRITAVELPSSSPASAVITCLPQVTALHDKLGLAEGALVNATGASFTHGQAFVGRGVEWRSFFHAWAPYQWPSTGQPFFPSWLKARSAGLAARLEDYCLPAVAARQGRVVASPAGDSRGPSHAGLHVAADRYAAYLKGAARSLDIQIVEAQSIDVEHGPMGIAAVKIDGGGARIPGHLFIDATGEAARLVGGLSAADWLGGDVPANGDRVLTGRAPRFNRVPPLSEVRVGASGWTALHPTQTMTAVTHLYSSKVTSDENARQVATAAADAVLEGVETRTIRPGIRREPWQRNCVAVGAAASVLDPLHDVASLVLQLGIVHLMALLPDESVAGCERSEYNRIMGSSLARIRDFQDAFYRVAAVPGAFWKAGREREPTVELAYKLAAFEARGLFAPMEDEAFSAESWQAVLDGLGVRPASLPPVVAGAPLEPIATELARQYRATKDAAVKMPTHEDYLSRTARSAPMR